MNISNALSVFALIIFSLSSSACFGDSLENTVEKMRQEACAGNVEGFMSYVDKNEVDRNERRKFIEEYKRERKEPESTWMKIIEFIAVIMYEYDYYPFDNETSKILKETADLLNEVFWKPIEYDLENGESSELCNLEILSVNKDADEVKIKLKNSGNEVSWKFNRNFNNQRKLVSYSNLKSEKAKEPEAESNTDTVEETEEAATPDSKEDKEDYDFRKTRWGMSSSEVKSSEDADYVGAGTIGIDDEEYDTSLVYEDKIGGLDVTILYIFTNEKLSQAIYQFKSKYSDPNTYLVNFNKMVEAYKKKYGAPWEVKEEWKDEKYKNDPDKVGQALTEGHISYATTWQTLETELTVGLNKGEDISLYVYYLSKHYDEKYERLKREREAEKKKEETEKKIEAKEIEEKL